MKIVQINTTPSGSTGSIMMNIHKELINQGHESYVVWGRGRKSNNNNEIFLNDKIGVYFHTLYTRLTGKVGFASKRSTKKLIKRLEQINPDIIHLHNLHGYYINIELLFNYLKKSNVKVIWTLHDCWAFTGHCTHFDSVKCDRWKKQCSNCPIKKEYPKSFIDNSSWCFNRKKAIFTSINDLIIITPSEWLASKVQDSFLNKYKIKVINNGIDTTIFKKIDKSKLLFRKKYNLKNKKIILGVAAPFTQKKGFNDFIELAKLLDDNYIIVLVGLNKKQIKLLPSNIIGIEKTDNVQELVDIYNSADVLFNPTYEDNYPTVNLESISCGTPVVTYKTGGSVEFVNFIVNEKNFVFDKKLAINDIVFFKAAIDDIIRTDIVIKDRKRISISFMTKQYTSLYAKKNKRFEVKDDERRSN